MAEIGLAQSEKLRIFLCHSSNDQVIVRELYSQLVQDGFAPWFDEVDVLPGQNRQLEIEKAVEAAHVVLVCLSSASVNKEGLIQKEITFALDLADEKPEGSIFIIPFRLQECELPRRLQRWSPEDYFADRKRAYERLLKAFEIRAKELGLKAVSNFLPPASSPTKGSYQYHNLPAPSYNQFVMRERAYNDLIDGLKQRSAVVLIASLGGMGKTSLVREVASRSLLADSDVPKFEAVVWKSDKEQPGSTNLEIVLDEVARVLDHPGLIQLENEDKRREVEKLLRQKAVLIVIDNFETINDSSLLNWLLRLPEPSKAIITTREFSHTFRNNTFVIDLQGMNEIEAQELIKHKLHMLGIQNLIHPAQLMPLVLATEGNPKAIEIALGYFKYEHRLLQEVINNLNAAQGELFEDLFFRCWNLLDDIEQKVLLCMGLFSYSVTSQALSTIVEIKGSAFAKALERLTDLALINKLQLDLFNPIRYTLHSLVKAFARARLAEATPEYVERIQLSRAKYFLDYSSGYLVRGFPTERYWNSMTKITQELSPLDVEWNNFITVLDWLLENGQDIILVEFMMVLVHYMDSRLKHNERIYYAQKAAEAANRLHQKFDEALFRIDALGWTFIETRLFSSAELEIKQGLEIAKELNMGEIEAQNLVALAKVFLARVYIEQGKSTKAKPLIAQARSLKGLRPRISSRVNMISGDYEYLCNNYSKAFEYYQEAINYCQNNEDGVDLFDLYYRLGLTHLANRNLEEAEITFVKILNGIQSDNMIEAIYAKYGLALIAKSKGKTKEVLEICKTTLEELSRLSPTHKLVQQIRELLISSEQT